MAETLFPTGLADRQWWRFDAAGFSSPVSGVVFRPDRPPCCGMPLGRRSATTCQSLRPLIPETTYWAAAKPPLGEWCYQGADGAAPFVIGCWGPPGWDWQISPNGPVYAILVDRLWQRTGDDGVLQAFYPSLKKNVVFTARLNPTPEGVISMPLDNRGMEWFADGSEAMESKMWVGDRASGYYLNFYEYGSTFIFLPEIMMLAMNYLYGEQQDLGLDLLRQAMEEMVCVQGHPWDLPNMIAGDTGRRIFGTDYYQNMMLWALPAALCGQDLWTSVGAGSLIDRILAA